MAAQQTAETLAPDDAAIAAPYRHSLANAIIDNFAHALDRFAEPVGYAPKRGDQIDASGAIDAHGRLVYRYDAILAGEEVRLYAATGSAADEIERVVRYMAGAPDPEEVATLTAYGLGCDETGNRTFLVLTAKVDCP